MPTKNLEEMKDMEHLIKKFPIERINLCGVAEILDCYTVEPDKVKAYLAKCLQEMAEGVMDLFSADRNGCGSCFDETIICTEEHYCDCCAERIRAEDKINSHFASLGIEVGKDKNV